jgi:hypothetical protein
LEIRKNKGRIVGNKKKKGRIVGIKKKKRNRKKVANLRGKNCGI